MTTAELVESAKILVSNEVENIKGTVFWKKAFEVGEFVTLFVLPILTPLFLMCLSEVN
ncbi:uncharacterized protein METZ01_LOCUS134322 [marine metagenome]|uniref:Uncharacterized protein n=1 Tax=marine metagenome TaxID=408172 RepID=A0A381YWS3_9ZZZZ|tara:strand:+ start:253 stop:426 length:174 start_codon:yes stop_codon:yes gene_type:complete